MEIDSLKYSLSNMKELSEKDSFDNSYSNELANVNSLQKDLKNSVDLFHEFSSYKKPSDFSQQELNEIPSLRKISKTYDIEYYLEQVKILYPQLIDIDIKSEIEYLIIFLITKSGFLKSNTDIIFLSLKCARFKCHYRLCACFYFCKVGIQHWQHPQNKIPAGNYLIRIKLII